MEHVLALLTLTAMEIVLGIDNIVFIAILTSRFDPARQKMARRLGLLAAMGMRIVLLLFLSVLASLTAPWFTVAGHEISGRDLILLLGGLFLIAKATYEIHHKLEGDAESHGAAQTATVTLGTLITQIVLIDIVFSIDSVITAIGMSDNMNVMIAAIVISIIVMMIFAETVSAFIEKHPTLKMLALSFLLLIGVMLTFEGFGGHMEKGYIYFAMGFSLFVEFLNLRLKASGQKLAKRIQEMEESTFSLKR